MKGAYILIPLLCTLCAGCDSKDESLMSTREIGFSTTVASSEAEPGTRAEATTDNLTEMAYSPTLRAQATSATAVPLPTTCTTNR